MEAPLKHMAGLVAMASILMLSPMAPAQASGHPILKGVIAGVAAHKLGEAYHKHQEKKKADAAAGIAPKPSPMGKEFDATLKERLARAKAERAAQREAQGQTGAPSFGQQFKERLAASRARQAQQAQQAQNEAPAIGRAPGQ